MIQACLLKQAQKAGAALFNTLDGYTLADLVQKPNPLRRALELP